MKTHITPEYYAWSGMIQRCHNPRSKNYPTYGGRGLIVCEAWRSSYEAFLSDMGSRPGHGYSLDRIDNDGNYEPGNCRWVTHRVQCNNRRKRPGTSAFVGVCRASNDRWRAQIGAGNNKRHLGTFDTEEEAATAVRTAKGSSDG